MENIFEWILFFSHSVGIQKCIQQFGRRQLIEGMLQVRHNLMHLQKVCSLNLIMLIFEKTFILKWFNANKLQLCCYSIIFKLQCKWVLIKCRDLLPARGIKWGIKVKRKLEWLWLRLMADPTIDLWSTDAPGKLEHFLCLPTKLYITI